MRMLCGTILAAVAVSLSGAVSAATCNVIVGSVNFESGTGLLPEVSQLVAGVSDPGNRLRGSLVWHQPWGDKKCPVVGAANFKITKFGEGL